MSTPSASTPPTALAAPTAPQAVLGRRALSSTAQKVLRVLAQADKPLSAYAILAKLTPQGLNAPPTVYRALEQLSHQGLVHRLESLNAFMACRHVGKSGKPQPHVGLFAICAACKAVSEIDDPALRKSVAQIDSAFLSRIDKKVIEISGLCHACRHRATTTNATKTKKTKGARPSKPRPPQKSKKKG